MFIQVAFSKVTGIAFPISKALASLHPNEVKSDKTLESSFYMAAFQCSRLPRFVLPKSVFLLKHSLRKQEFEILNCNMNRAANKKTPDLLWEQNNSKRGFKACPCFSKLSGSRDNEYKVKLYALFRT
ncbi:hypothetical protein L596_012916 [Steinernema carpocapsae]|uniref:Uncharacterized protein n=1 Tax=Steinernema carpocapsae TaxID=34508 RepID=A0A4V6A4Y1_STECR|nr:hypothetical protein L596_012916 [Steinernema carpocapsae]